MRDLEFEDRKQFKERRTLESQLQKALSGVSTTKALRAKMPEMEKYIRIIEGWKPPPVEPDRTLPVDTSIIANLMAKLVEMGWPKDKAEKEARAKTTEGVAA